MNVFRRTDLYLCIPLLIAAVVAVAVILMNIQITSFRNSYFAELKTEIRRSNLLAVEAFTPLLVGNDFRKLDSLLGKNSANPMIVQIKAPGGETLFETPNAPLYLREHMKRPRTREIIRGTTMGDVAIEYNPYYRAWMAYHSLSFRVDGREYLLTMAELCNSVSRIIRLSEFAMAALSFFGFLIVAGLLVYFFRQVRSPLLRLQASTREIASGNLDCPVFVPDRGAVREIALCVRDMANHLKSRIAELRKLESCRREFITAISHAMKTPVTAILSAVEGIEQGALDDPEYREECIGALKIQSQRLAVLLHDFLNLTALELQELKPDRDFLPLSTHELLVNAAEAFRHVCPEVVVQVCGADVEISGDPNLLQQALANLLNNAVLHGGARRIELVCNLPDEQVELLIRDNGSGIDPRYLDRIFDRFFRAPSRRKQQVPGNGLGLAIVKHIVRLHHGTVSVESSENGTAFRILLPRKKPDISAVKMAEEPYRQKRKTEKT